MFGSFLLFLGRPSQKVFESYLRQIKRLDTRLLVKSALLLSEVIFLNLFEPFREVFDLIDRYAIQIVNLILAEIHVRVA